MKKFKIQNSKSAWKSFTLASVILLVVLGWMFRDSFQPDLVHFSNDGPMGNLTSKYMELPEGWTGVWNDLHWLGLGDNAAQISFTYVIRWLLGPIPFAKFYPPICLFVLGLSAWAFSWYALGLRNGCELILVVAAAFNSNFLSNTAWGLGTRALTLAYAFLACALLTPPHRANPWVKAWLAGSCVGMGIVEGADNGGLFAILVASYYAVQCFSQPEPLADRCLAFGKLLIVVAAAGFTAAQSLISLSVYLK